MMWLENIRVSIDSIRSNWLRAFLTLMIIAFGIMALVGILTAIDTIIYSMSSNFSTLGANSFAVQPLYSDFQSSRRGRVQKRGESITFDQAMEFKDRFDQPAKVGVSFVCTNNAAVKYENKKTNPTVLVLAGDENAIGISGTNVAYGRNFTPFEVESGSMRTVIGQEIVDLLFDGIPEKALNEIISIGSNRFKVIGILEEKGAVMNSSQDRKAIIPIMTGKRFYGSINTNYNIQVEVNVPEQITEISSHAIGVMRNVRSLKAGQDNDFTIRMSDGIIDIIRENTVMLRSATVAIGLMTLLGAAIGLMNIMLVSVTERTREIGVLKAVGASQRNIMIQFLTEAVLISLIGGLLGILLGILVGNVVTLLIGGEFLIPWAWITLGIIVCTAVGLASGIYPAVKASKLDPIEALRHS